MSSPIKIISSMATKPLLADLVASLPPALSQNVQVESVGGVDAAKRVQGGEQVDVVVLAGDAIDKLLAHGSLVAGSRVDLVRSGVAVAVREGAPAVDIGSEQALKAAVLGARTIGYSTGPSGVQLQALFDRWGITPQIQDRIVQATPGVPVASMVAKGEVELGFQQLSEMRSVPGIVVLGPLPEQVQIITTFAAAISANCTEPDAAKAVLAGFAAPAMDDVKRNNGMEPA